MRVLVIGGRGYVGRGVVEAVCGQPGWEVAIGSRRAEGGAVRVDLNQPVTFDALDACDVAVNCSDSLRAPPRPAAEYALARGLTFIEVSADTGTVESLLELRRRHDSGPGQLLIGLGLFPGLSNLVARRAFERVHHCERLEFGARITPFAGAGEGTCALMTRGAEAPAVRYQDSRRIEESPVAPGIRMRFGSRSRATLRAGLPENVMFHASMSVPTTASYLALRPALLRYNFGLLGLAIPHAGPLKRPLIHVLDRSILWMRTRLLRNRPEPIELTVRAVSRRGDVVTGPWVRVDDGMLAASIAAAAGVTLLAERPHVGPGVYLPDELFGLAEFTARMRDLAGSRLNLTVRDETEMSAYM